MEALRAKLAAHNQGHLLDFYPTLSESEQAELLSNVSAIDVERVNGIFKTAMAAKPTSTNVAPLPPAAQDSTITASPDKLAAWRNEGLTLIGKGKVAVILLAGGQGTRLGSSDPKGCYDIKLPSGKSLFQLQGERILRLQQVFFFNQGVLPAFTPEGKIFLESKTCPAFSPDGNGGIYAALRSEGVIADLEKRGIPYVHAYCVDNCLVKVADPVFIGYCVEKNADCGCKAVPKTKPSEAVGVICLRDGKPSVVEYSEIDQSLSEARDSAGNLVYNAANIANHFYTTEFLKRIKDFEAKLEYHIARKKIKHVDPSGAEIKPTANNGIKLELFIFDVLPFAERFAVLETARKDEFSPLKNAPGSKDGDSPDTSRADIMAQHVRFVEAIGGKVAEGPGGTAPVFEISPLVSYDGEGLEKLTGHTIPTPKLISSAADIAALIN
ncbi:UDP-N-acetylglucosamine pyrophosphorylase [Kappamyces sp. JEL0680]|nr:UDP-N-acetylglucosamine pyrophosphorylase [Kappamyces sp. JEL0680]